MASFFALFLGRPFQSEEEGAMSRGTREELLSSRSQKLCLFFLSLSRSSGHVWPAGRAILHALHTMLRSTHLSLSLSGGLGTKTPFADISDSIPLPIRPVWPLGVSKWIIWRPTSVPEKREKGERERERESEWTDALGTGVS